MSHRLVDKLGDEDYGGDDAGDEADGAHDDVEVGEAHDDAVAEEAEEDHEDEDADTDHEMYRDHAHGSTAACGGCHWRGEAGDAGHINNMLSTLCGLPDVVDILHIFALIL